MKASSPLAGFSSSCSFKLSSPPCSPHPSLAEVPPPHCAPVPGCPHPILQDKTLPLFGGLYSITPISRGFPGVQTGGDFLFLEIPRCFIDGPQRFRRAHSSLR